jgi:hypothetical protein
MAWVGFSTDVKKAHKVPSYSLSSGGGSLFGVCWKLIRYNYRPGALTFSTQFVPTLCIYVVRIYYWSYLLVTLPQTYSEASDRATTLGGKPESHC